MNAAERFHQVRPFVAGLALLATHIIACGQGFVTSFGGPGAQDGVGVIQQGSEFWVASREFNTEDQRFQAYLYRRSSSGQALATQVIDLPGTPFLQGSLSANDDGAIIFGSVIRAGRHTHDGVLIRVNGSGEVVWTAIPERVGDQLYLGAAAMADGGVVVCGTQNSGTGHDALLVRFSAAGEVLWEVVEEEPLDREYHAVAVAGDQGCVVTGRTVNFSGSTDLVYARYTSEGQQLWLNFLGGTANEEGRSIVPAGDGSFVVAGHSMSYGPIGPQGQRKEHVFIAKVQLNGDTLWTRAYGDADQGRRAFAMDVAPNGDLLLSGERYTATSSEALVLRFDPMGQLLWERVFDLGRSERLIGLQALEDGFVACGWAFEAQGRQVMLIRRNANGF